jgi:hypothetical protein
MMHAGPTPTRVMLLCALAVCLSPVGPVRAEEPRTLATLGDVEITVADVDLQLGRAGSATARQQPLTPGVLMAAVDIIARQRRALATLTKQRKRVSDAEIARWLEENSPQDPQPSAAELLAAQAAATGVTPDALRDFLAFRLSWQAYIRQQMTEANLARHYKNQRPRFDGTRFLVQHAFISVPPGQSLQRDTARQWVEKLHAELAGGGRNPKADVANDRPSFPVAVEKLAADVALEVTPEPVWVTGSGPVLPGVVDVILKLQAGDLSDVFETSQGVHVIQLQQLETGQRTLEDAKEEVRRHMLLHLLDFLAKSSEAELPLRWVAGSAAPESRLPPR